jgi:hypothetical protein
MDGEDKTGEVNQCLSPPAGIRQRQNSTAVKRAPAWRGDNAPAANNGQRATTWFVAVEVVESSVAVVVRESAAESLADEKTPLRLRIKQQPNTGRGKPCKGLGGLTRPGVTLILGY